MAKTTETPWLTVTQAMQMLNDSGIAMSKPTLLTLVKNEDIAHMQIGNRYFIAKETIEAILRGEFKQEKRKKKDESK